MAAILIARAKELRDDGSIVEVVVWQLPDPIAPCAHRYKYRLYFGTRGVARVRYDNERGKGGHRNLGSLEERYAFTTLAQLLEDFQRDVENWS